MRVFVIDTSNMAPELHGGLIGVKETSNPTAAEKQECPAHSRLPPASVVGHTMAVRSPTGFESKLRPCEVLAGFGHLWGSRVETSSKTQRVGMRAFVSDTTARRGSLIAAPVLPFVSRRRCETAGFALDVFVEIVTTSKFTPKVGGPVQTPETQARTGRSPLSGEGAISGGSGCARQMRAKTLAEPEVISRGTLFRKDKTVQFREAHDAVSGR